MDKERTKDLIKIMQASLEGEVIECKLRNSTNPLSTWFTHSGNDWNTNAYMYRIKPKPQYRPFKNQEECWKEMKNHQPFGWIKVGGHYENIVDLKTGDEIFVNRHHYTWNDAYKEITFADGTPFGMKITDNCPALRKAPK